MALGLSKISTRIPGISTQTLNEEQLFTRLKSGHQLVTANSRLSRVLRDRYNHWRISNGDRQWKSPRILSWSSWLEGLWESAGLKDAKGADRSVPGERQLLSLWESTLRAEPSAGGLLRPEALAGQLRDTRQLVTEWQVDLADPCWFTGDNENHHAFQLWNRSFERRCRQAGWLEPADRYAILSLALADGLVEVSAPVDLLGFDELSPARIDLLKAMINEGVAAHLVNMKPQHGITAHWAAQDKRGEVQQMARWVRYWAEKEPGATIAIVVHDLQNRREEVNRVLGDILCPGKPPASTQLWNISVGTPLARVPVIETALDLFNLLGKGIDIHLIGRVLRSPWLPGATEERNNRALLEKCIRENYPRRLKLGELLYRSSEIKKHDRGVELPLSEQHPQPWSSPRLNAMLKRLSRFRQDTSTRRPPSSWAESMDKLLNRIGWPAVDAGPAAEAVEGSETWQVLQSWREALRELASLDATEHQLGRATAIRRLRQICNDRIFQVRTPPTRIQVLGLYEISALRFDHVWVLGLDNDNWPPAAKPNPFIPGKLQRDAGLPHSSPQRELKVARTVTGRLLETSPDCVFSFASQLDGEDRLPSPLLLGEEFTQVDSVPGWTDSSWIESVTAASGPVLTRLEMPGPLQHGTARGGSSILKHQALCPFRAFATNRLGAESMETPVDGISPALHGSLVHSVLEHFWKETESQSALLQLGQVELESRVRKHVEDVVSEERGLKLRPAFQAVEADRVRRHVLSFLELEKQREPFQVIGFEQKVLPVIEGQSINLFIDRIDQLPGGDTVIIDYKTGTVEPAKWFGERPEDPQLPLYAISADTTPAAVCFAVLRDDGQLYKGVVKRPGILPGLPPARRKSSEALIEAGENMQETIIEWRQTLHRLVAEFLAGKADIDPKREDTCRNSYCELHTLCRINELRKRQAVDGANDLQGLESGLPQ